MTRKPNAKQPNRGRNPKPQGAGNALNGDVKDSAFVVGENSGVVIGGYSEKTLDERFKSVTERLCEQVLSSLETSKPK